MQTTVHLETVTSEPRPQISALLKDPKRSASARDKLRELVVQSLANSGQIYLHHEGLPNYTFRSRSVVPPWAASNRPLMKPIAEFAEFGSPVYRKFFYKYLYKNFAKPSFETRQTRQACLHLSIPVQTWSPG